MPRNPDNPVGPYAQPTGQGHLLPSRAVATRYDVHLNSLPRWIANGIIPPPDQVICGRKYWLAETLDAADRERARAYAAAGRPKRTTRLAETSAKTASTE